MASNLLQCVVPALVIAFAVSVGPVAEVRAAAGEVMPECALEKISDGDRAIDLQALRGRVVLVDFWASWCAPCAHAFSHLNAWQTEFADRGLAVVGISVDERSDDARRFLQRHPASFPTALDRSGHCPKAFAVDAMPSSYLIDRQGRIIEVHRGFTRADAAARREAILRALERAP